jgi:hypothetical protein
LRDTRLTGTLPGHRAGGRGMGSVGLDGLALAITM